MPLINFEINLFLTWSNNCVIFSSNAAPATIYATTDTKCYVLVVSLSTNANTKLLKQSKISIQRQD